MSKYHALMRRYSTSHKTILYGWGQTQALPLLKGTMDRVFTKPICLRDEEDYALPQKEGIVSHIATGWGHSLIGINSQQVYAYGLNKSGQLGTGQKSNFGGQRVFSTENKLILLGCGREHSHIVTENENHDTYLYSFGNDMYGQLGLGQHKNTNPGQLLMQDTPRLVDFSPKIEHLACGLDNTVLSTTDHTVYAMGWGSDGQLGQGFDNQIVPSKVTFKDVNDIGKIYKISGSTDFTLLLTVEGNLWTWGNSEYGQGIQGKKIDRILEPLMIDAKDVIDIAAGGPFSIILTTDGKVHTCGYGALGLGEGLIESLELRCIQELDNIVRIYATTDYAAAISASGELFTWGLGGASGRLGLGHTYNSYKPQQVDIGRHVVDLSLGTNHALAICTD
ncbi:regulator of chromosome condensation 1/beta-lactamase-inhibitor protein II [Pilobolus umbonatus]|nr:regulator of chromosome condensation 1/beta-lactamase-inhibitor protein II [Pilobolus umbonatus]